MSKVRFLKWVTAGLGLCLLIWPGRVHSWGSESKSGQKPKKVYTNEDLSELKTSKRVNQAPDRSSESSKTKEAKGLPAYRDSNGHDRSYWRQKVQPLRNRLEALDTQIAALEARRGKLSATSGIKVTRSGKLRTNSSDTRVQLDRRIDDLKREKTETQMALQDLEEDARKAGAFPEWVR